MNATAPQAPHSATAQIFKSHDTITPAQASAYLGVAATTLSIWRCTKRYPLPYIKCGRLVRYRVSDLEAFMASRTIGGTV